MTETVLVVPLLMLILALMVYLGYVVVRMERASVMARYETWRDVTQAPGPASGGGNPELNSAFLGGNADTLAQRADDNYFPEDPYDQFRKAGQTSPDAGALTENLIMRPGGEYRMSRGRRESFGMHWDNTADLWNKMSGLARFEGENPEAQPLIRGFVRVGNDWRYTNDWRAGADLWADTNPDESSAHHLRALRDSFMMSFDADLDAIDGRMSPEYSDQAMPENPNNIILAGIVRALYLRAPDYRGPVFRVPAISYR